MPKRFFTGQQTTGNLTPQEADELELLTLRKRKAESEALKSVTAPEGVMRGERATAPSTTMQRAAAVNPLTAFGLTDEAAGALAGASTFLQGEGFQKGFGETTADVRQGLDIAREERPGETLGLELGGAVATGGALPSLGKRAATTLGGRVAQGAKFGAGAGAVAGAGEAEGGVAERAKGAARGALVGTVAGGTLPVVGQAAKSTVKQLPLVKRFFETGGTKGEKFIAEAAKRDKLDFTAVAEKLKSTKPNTIADVGGENIKALARVSVGGLGEARQKGKKFLEDRARKETKRINADISTLID